MDQNVFDQLVDLKKKQLGLVKKAEQPAKQPEPQHIRTVGNLDTIVESQRIYNPSLPPTNPNLPASGATPPAQPTPKGPPAKMVHTGTAGASDLEGNWGTPAEKK